MTKLDFLGGEGSGQIEGGDIRRKLTVQNNYGFITETFSEMDQ